jgi:dTDP-4-dehydrorhamnose 3,5-epimerase-like enzyme
MTHSEDSKKFEFDRPGNYRIRVQGFLDKKWSERLGGFHITTSKTGDQKSVTVLKGQVSDQAELVGVLSTLYQRHLTLLSVEYLNGN